MLLILGLDGATLDLVEPWTADGTLPNLARLLRQGAWGRLASTMPAATFPSWTTFMTGVNPGRHGVFDFTRRDPGSYRVRFVNATFRKARTVWRLLSDAGRRVSVLGVPATYPPEAINGYMISGFDTPVTTHADASFVHPPEFAAEVEEAGGFPFADFQEFHIGPGWHARAAASLCDGIERKTRRAEVLAQMRRAGRAGNRDHVIALREQPGQCELRRRRAKLARDRLITVEQFQVGRVGRRLEARHVAAQVLRLERADVAQRAGQVAACERAERDERDAKVATGRQCAHFSIARPQRVLRLQRRDRVDGVRLAQRGR